MGAVVNKLPKTANQTTFSNTHKYKRRVFEVRSPCQWLTHCHNGKCPAFQRINGNYYCMREGIT